MSTPTKKSPLRWAGVLFALVVNMLLVTLADMIVARLAPASSMMILATAVAPLVAGILAALYVKQRGGAHAFLGGMLSAPLLTFLVFSGVWQFGLLAGAFCALGGAITEVLLRDRKRSG